MDAGLLNFDGVGFDLSANAAAPLAPWALRLMERAYFMPKGLGPDAFDCWGLVSFVQASELARPVKSYEAAYAEADFSAPGALDRLIRAEAQTWTRGDGSVGDVIVAARGRLATHVAVLCGAGRALHALDTAGIVITTLLGRAAVRRLLDYRIVGCVRPA